MTGKQTAPTWRPETCVVHAGRGIDPQTGSVVPPIHLSTTFARGDDGELLGGFLYGRYDNPNRHELEACLAELEGAAAAMAFASGSAVAHALLSSLGGGDRLVIAEDLYFGIRILCRAICARAGIALAEVDLCDVEAAARALAAPRTGRLLVVCESPSNPLLRVADLARLAELAHAAGGELVVDNTFATPLLQAPLALGADYVMHSTTKFLGGHSDVLGGALLARDPEAELWRRVAEVRQQGGGVPSPFDCWLLLRGVATLALRVERQVDSAAKLAPWLAAHAAVEGVLYPGLAGHPGHAVAARQMRRPGALLSLLVAGGEEAAARFMAGLRLVARATSLGGVHTLAEHRARVEGPTSTTPRNLVRLSVGIEAYEDIREDIESALASL
jgi:cystathionine gamma-synthase